MLWSTDLLFLEGSGLNKCIKINFFNTKRYSQTHCFPLTELFFLMSPTPLKQYKKINEKQLLIPSAL